jgi:hypothetical protein
MWNWRVPKGLPGIPMDERSIMTALFSEGGIMVLWISYGSSSGLTMNAILERIPLCRHTVEGPNARD